MKNLILSILLICPQFIIAQNNIPTGAWRTHYSYNTTISITQSNNDVYAASFSGLYIVDKTDKSITSLTKLNGLSETGISVINYNSTTNTLLISYENGQIDLIADNIISSISDIKLSDIFNSKLSHHMNESGILTYLSTDFGLIEIDTEVQRIKESYLNLSTTGDNLKIFASTIYNDSLFLATETGVIAGSLAENLKDFTKWKRFGITEGINQERAQVIGLYNGKPITGNLSQGLLTYENGNWMALGELVGTDFTSIESNVSTMVSASGKIYELTNLGLKEVISSHLVMGNSAIFDNTHYWIADGQNGLVHINEASHESIYPNGPFFNDIVKLKSVQNKIFAIPSFKDGNGAPLLNNAGFSVFENGEWENYNSTGYPNTNSIPTFLDISAVSYLASGEIVFSSFGYGLLFWSNGNFEIINENNSPIINSSPPDRSVLIADIANDNSNLWVLNNSTSSSLHVYARDNSWVTYSPPSSVSSAKQIESTPWGEQWIAINSTAGGGIVVYNTNGEELILKSDGLGTIPSNSINQILLDKEDKIWIATTKGVVYYQFPFSIIEDPTQEAIIPIIDSQLLFNNENVNCLAVDGGNRIWMGTNKGVWLFANDGSELIEHFNTENSPLLSDVVTNIAIDDSSGEVFFSTDKGLISYRGSGTITRTYASPKIFPNPVAPGFTGVITIEGVPTNSEIKITDASGRLVINIEANGNTAIWDMNSAYSNQVGTGVYFVFVSSSDGTNTQIGKIAIVK